MVKNLPAKQNTGFDSWVGKIPWRRKWQPTPVFLPGKYHGQRSLAGCSLWGLRESDDLATECKREVAEGLRAVIASVVN